MSDVPADIQETALKLTKWEGTPFLSGMIVTALWAERARCAGLARWHLQGVLEDAIRTGQNET